MGSSSIRLVLVGVGLFLAHPVLAQPGAAFPPPAAQPTAAPAPAQPPAPAPAATPPAPVTAVPPPATAPAPAPSAAPAAQPPPPVTVVPVVREAPPPVNPSEFFFAGPQLKVYPEEAAVDSSPFIDASISLVSMEDRLTDPFVFGIALGAYVARRVRLVARLEMPSSDNGDDNYYDGTGYSLESKSATLIYGGAVGIIAAYSQSFVFSPGLTFLRTDVGEYGNMLGIAIPFEWTTNRGLRFGFEVGFGRSFGGTHRVQLPGTCAPGGGCTTGPVETRDREAARALVLRFEMGFGFNHPQPRAAAL